MPVLLLSLTFIIIFVPNNKSTFQKNIKTSSMALVLAVENDDLKYIQWHSVCYTAMLYTNKMFVFDFSVGRLSGDGTRSRALLLSWSAHQCKDGRGAARRARPARGAASRLEDSVHEPPQLQRLSRPAAGHSSQGCWTHGPSLCPPERISSHSSSRQYAKYFYFFFYDNNSNCSFLITKIHKFNLFLVVYTK